MIFAIYHKSLPSIFIRNKGISHLFLSLDLCLVEKVTVTVTKIKVCITDLFILYFRLSETPYEDNKNKIQPIWRCINPHIFIIKIISSKKMGH